MNQQDIHSAAAVLWQHFARFGLLHRRFSQAWIGSPGDA